MLLASKFLFLFNIAHWELIRKCWTFYCYLINTVNFQKKCFNSLDLFELQHNVLTFLHVQSIFIPPVQQCYYVIKLLSRFFYKIIFSSRRFRASQELIFSFTQTEILHSRIHQHKERDGIDHNVTRIHTRRYASLMQIPSLLDKSKWNKNHLPKWTFSFIPNNSIVFSVTSQIV